MKLTETPIFFVRLSAAKTDGIFALPAAASVHSSLQPMLSRKRETNRLSSFLRPISRLKLQNLAGGNKVER